MDSTVTASLVVAQITGRDRRGHTSDVHHCAIPTPSRMGFGQVGVINTSRVSAGRFKSFDVVPRR